MSVTSLFVGPEWRAEQTLSASGRWGTNELPLLEPNGWSGNSGALSLRRWSPRGSWSDPPLMILIIPGLWRWRSSLCQARLEPYLSSSK